MRENPVKKKALVRWANRKMESAQLCVEHLDEYVHWIHEKVDAGEELELHEHQWLLIHLLWHGGDVAEISPEDADSWRRTLEVPE